MATTVKEMIEELSKLPPDSAVMFPIQWTVESFQDLWGDTLKKPINPDKWAKIADAYEANLGKFFWEDAEEAMHEVLQEMDLLKEDY